jgi:hypothetical protein
LEREIRSAVSYVNNQVRTRHAHPTYGVTKKGLNAALQRAEGLIVAHMILAGNVNNFNTNGNPVSRYAETFLGVDLQEARDRVKEA